MAWVIKGHYVSSCSCTNVCPCPTASAPPDNPDGSTNCWGIGVWDVREGNSGDVDLSGARFAISVHFPERSEERRVGKEGSVRRVMAQGRDRRAIEQEA